MGFLLGLLRDMTATHLPTATYPFDVFRAGKKWNLATSPYNQMETKMIILHVLILAAMMVFWIWQAKNIKGALINILINIVTFIIAVNSLTYVLRYFGIK